VAKGGKRARIRERNERDCSKENRKGVLVKIIDLEGNYTVPASRLLLKEKSNVLKKRDKRKKN